jgi:hypothetical protein
LAAVLRATKARCGPRGQKGKLHETQLILFRCAVCRKFVVVRVRKDGLERHANGVYVQHAFPYLSAAERELFITQTCGDCWAILCVDPITHPFAYN